MITLNEILKKEEAQTILPTKVKKRLLANILKQLIDLTNKKQNEK